MDVKQVNKNKKNDNKKNNQKKKSFLHLLFINLFGGKKKMDVFEEEIQSPWQTVRSTFKDDKVAMTAFITFLVIVAIVLVVPVVHPIDLSFSETSQQNVEPGLDLMKVPESLKGKVQDIAIGPTFSVGVSTDGKLYIWGKTRISSTINVKKIPADMGNITKVAAGFDHILALNDEGKLFAWGNDRQRQISIPPELGSANIVDIAAGYQNSIVLTEDGHVHYFGNSMNNDYDEFHSYQGQLKKVKATSDAVVGLTFDGQVVYLGNQQNAYSNVPKDMGNVIDIATTASTMAALNDQGQVFVWGNVSEKGEGRVPKTESKIVSIQGGRYHYTACNNYNY